MKTVMDLNRYLNSIEEVPKPSVDRIVYGQEDMEIQKIATCWLPYLESLKQAKQLGANVVVCHEPLFYSHLDPLADGPEYRSFPNTKKAYEALIQEKQDWLKENRMAVIRCHDVLDKVEGFGIPFALAEFLGLDRRIAQEDFYQVYEVNPQAAGLVARAFLEKFKTIGQEILPFYGDQSRQVSKIGIGTGCFSDPQKQMEMGADFLISINDTARTWVQCAFSRDSGIPLIVIDHGSAEEMGVRKLSQKLQRESGYETFHIPQGCGFQVIS